MTRSRLLHLFSFTVASALQAEPRLAVGQGPDPLSPSEVAVFAVDPVTPVFPNIHPYAANYGANDAFGEVDGDGLDELLTGPGPGTALGPHVRGWDETGAPVTPIGFYAYSTLNYGVNVSGNDLGATGTGVRDEIVTGAGRGQVFSPHVRGFKFDGARVIAMNSVSFYAWSGIRYGADVTDGDLDGDGDDEILVTTGPESGLGSMRAFDWENGRISMTVDWDTSIPVNVAAAQLDLDAADELLIAPSVRNFGAHIRGFESDGTAIAKVNFYGFNCSTCGANLAAGDLDGDSYDEIVVTPWAGPNILGPAVSGFNYDGASLAAIPGLNFTAFSSGRYGTNLAISDTGW